MGALRVGDHMSVAVDQDGITGLIECFRPYQIRQLALQVVTRPDGPADRAGRVPQRLTDEQYLPVVRLRFLGVRDEYLPIEARTDGLPAHRLRHVRGRVGGDQHAVRVEEVKLQETLVE